MNDRTRIERHGFRVASVLSLLLVSACGSTPSTQKSHSSSPSAAADKSAKSDQTAAFPKDLLPAELLPTLPLVAPQSDLDIPVFSDIVDIDPGGDQTFCTFSNVILDEDTIFAESYGAESPFGHHAILQYNTTPQDPHTGDCGQMDGQMLLGGSGGKNVSDKPTLPEHYGVSVPAGAQLVLNHHWINTSDQPVKGQAMMLARRLPAGGDTVLGGSLPMLGLGWEIPPSGAYTYSNQCTFAEDVSYVLAVGHMHEYGHQVNIDVTRADGTTDSLIDEPWNADSGTTAGGKIFTLENPYVIHKGDTVTLTCNWQNTTTSAIDFPREMCIFFGFTVGTNAYCVNGSWYTPDQVMKSGVSAQSITNNM
jgi:hypothetical protein